VPNKVAGLRSGSNTSFGKTTLARASLNAICRRVASHRGIARSLNAHGVGNLICEKTQARKFFFVLDFVE